LRFSTTAGLRKSTRCTAHTGPIPQLIPHRHQGPILSTTDFLPWFSALNYFVKKLRITAISTDVYVSIAIHLRT
jgi:hypothetical protein